MRLTPARIALHAAVLALWLATCAAFFALARWAHGTYFLPFDKKPSIWVQKIPANYADPLFEPINRLGDFGWVAAALIALFAVLLVRGRLVEATIVLGAGAMQYAYAATRAAVDRPFSWDEPPVPVRVFPNADSFPSGHVFGEVMAYGLILAFIPRIVPWWPVAWLVRMLCAFVIVVGVPARLYYGAHWTSDVIGSVLLAAMYLIPALWIDALLQERAVAKHDRETALSTGAITPFRLRTPLADDDSATDALPAHEAPRG